MSDDGRASARSLFAGHDDALAILERATDLVEALGPVELRVGRSQIAFRARRGFAYLWRPTQFLAHGAPAVLSIPLARIDSSARWKEVAHPSPRVWMHHLELASPDDLDAEVVAWLNEARAAAL
jgi:hypothetical protein